jgi:NAD(P)-dependent dehydrogenase (short-subunit alcohol dehydrogenase family)
MPSIYGTKRVAQATDIAGAMAFLASDDAQWVTGDTFRVDGGSKLYSQRKQVSFR